MAIKQNSAHPRRPLPIMWIPPGGCRKLVAVTPGLSLLRKHRLRLALWVAPALLFRALIPVGFMLEPVAGRAEIVLCGADAPRAMHAHGGHDPAAHHQHSHADPTCPYAQSAGPTPLPSLAVLTAAPMAPVFELPARIQQTHAHFGPTREHAPRAPPRLA
jgi:hypothetical protein